MSEKVEFHNHTYVKVLCDDGVYRKTAACRIAPEDVNDDGTISWPPSGTCDLDE